MTLTIQDCQVTPAANIFKVVFDRSMTSDSTVEYKLVRTADSDSFKSTMAVNTYPFTASGKDCSSFSGYA